MITVNIHEAKTNLSALVAGVEHRNETVIICRHGHAVAELVPIPQGSRLKADPRLKKIKILDNPTAATIREWENV
ncbi:MAG: type II toxin-antitoxin system Phd/YefM family antitoxin [Chitinivibrionales bacterium]|nr:type II toxin-antitoxin system Phd/YefM family antitoxin [Chitinivibrionales bacterium]